ncbi:Co-chaperone Hsc20 [Parathielavia appendiculata]|uniref:Co-chaperone Hsc20 n=1 Tax=Parathielavia appendiculata TaxID=2587402 RepID=A0AAN6U6R8_9PEZI|nr:Co-chaperone Hsc20 [Parathielavia appendiculata]
MRTSLVSSTRRAAAHLCVACRRDAVVGLPSQNAASRVAATAPARRSLRTAVTQHIQGPATHRWSSVSQFRHGSTSSSTATAPQPHSSPSSPQLPAYYALFPETLPDGPPPAGKFHIDVRALRREFLRLQAASHPDFYHSASHSNSAASQQDKSTKSSARLRAEATSALINTAYKTLSNPLLRAQYLLREQYGIDLEGDEAGKHSEPDPELLMTVLEAREAMEMAEKEEDLAGLVEENGARIERSETVIGEALEKGDLEAAKGEAVRLRYWVNIREGLTHWEKGKEVVLQH